MGSIATTKTGRYAGKVESPRLLKMEQEFLASGGEFKAVKMSEIFTISTPKKRFDANKIEFGGIYPYIARGDKNNGVRGYITEDIKFLNSGNTISFGQDTATMFYQAEPYFTGDKIKVFTEKTGRLNRQNAQYIITSMKRAFSLFGWGSSSFNEKVLNDTTMSLPFSNGKIAFDFMENFVSELQASRLRELQNYLKVTGLANYELSDEERKIIEQFDELLTNLGGVKRSKINLLCAVEWGNFNLKALFGKATRGKRLKSADRITGDLPFVTAGETDTGISAFIGNSVDIFPKNTVTIDMFGSAKYRNYAYGADDHIAVVHCDKWEKHAVIFLATAIHKVANAGQFSYARNFYAKDADELIISLPTQNGKPDFALMEMLGKAIEKLVIADVVKYADREMAAYEQVIQ